jgi:hypothetical protein
LTTPVRIQRSRRKGSKLTSPNGLPVVCVTRGTRYGNPWTLERAMDLVGDDPDLARQAAVQAYRTDLEDGQLEVSVEDVKRDLRGKNLACWCSIDETWCHADVLLEVANG